MNLQVIKTILILSFSFALGAPWSNAQDLRITEIHYHPSFHGDAEFIELKNVSSTSISLLGLQFSKGIDFAFTEDVQLPSGETLVLVKDPEIFKVRFPQFTSYYPVPFQGSLDNGGERLELVEASGEIIDSVRFNDRYPFSFSADGLGNSLNLNCKNSPGDAPFNWKSQSPSPGEHAEENACPPSPEELDITNSPIAISEIHYHPVGDPDPREEYIELSHRGSSALDLAGWRFTRGIRFTFPANSMLQPGERCLVAQDPEAIILKFNLDPNQVYGPFTDDTQLSNSGETLRLENAQGQLQEQIRYSDAGKWPAFADGLGGSLQRADLHSDATAPGNWRVARFTPPTTGQGQEWQKVEWEGFHEGPRFYFYLLDEGQALIDDVVLEVVGGDGTNYFQNGDFDQPFDRWNSNGNHNTSRRLSSGGFGNDGPCGLIAATGSGSGFQSSLRYTFPERPPEGVRLRFSFQIKHRSGESQFIARSSVAQEDNGLLYVAGDTQSGETVSVHPSPLQENPVDEASLPPTVDFIDFQPRRPRSDDSVVLQAQVICESSATVVARVEGGTQDPLEVPLTDNGVQPDVLAGDGIYSGTVPPFPHNTLVWFSIQARSTDEVFTVWPRHKNPSEVSGWYVHNSIPTTEDPVRLFHLMTPGSLSDLSCSAGAYREGDFVDPTGRARRGVGIKFRGDTACHYPKKPIRVRFNKGDTFEGQSRLNFNAGWNDKGMFREPFGFDFFEEAGVPYCETHVARVHTQNGAFHGMYFTIEDPREEFLERNELHDNTALYKARTPLRNASTSGFEPRTEVSQSRLSEVGTFANRMLSLNGQALIDHLNENLDVEQIIDYQAVQVIIIDGDSVAKNWLLTLGHPTYLNSENAKDKIGMLPWDIDLSYGQMLLTTDVRHYNIHPLFQTQTYPFHDQGYHGLLTALLQRAPNDFYIKAYYGRMWNLLQDKFTPARLTAKMDRYDDATLELAQQDLQKWGRWGSQNRNPHFWRNDARTFFQRRHAFLIDHLSKTRPTTLGRSFRYVPAPKVRITEIHYNPKGEDDEEFIEIHNFENEEVDLAGWSLPLTGFTFGPNSRLGAGETAVIARRPDLLALWPELAQVQLFGPLRFSLSNQGGDLRLRDDGDDREYYPETIDLVRYRDGRGWPQAADGEGPSLELIERGLDNDFPSSWRAGWSPGQVALENQPPQINVVITPIEEPENSVILNARNSSDPEGDSIEFEWHFPDDDFLEGDLVLFTAEEPGTYSVLVTATDALGQVANLVTEFEVPSVKQPQFRRGDANLDRNTDLSDAITMLGHLFLGDPATPRCFKSLDFDDTGELDLTDPITLLAHLFLGNHTPNAPFPNCGVDPTEDDLSCEDGSSCQD